MNVNEIKAKYCIDDDLEYQVNNYIRECKSSIENLKKNAGHFNSIQVGNNIGQIKDLIRIMKIVCTDKKRPELLKLIEKSFPNIEREFAAIQKKSKNDKDTLDKYKRDQENKKLIEQYRDEVGYTRAQILNFKRDFKKPTQRQLDEFLRNYSGFVSECKKKASRANMEMDFNKQLPQLEKLVSEIKKSVAKKALDIRSYAAMKEKGLI